MTDCANRGLSLAADGAGMLERAIAHIQDDELVEATPKVVRIRKRYLDPHERKRGPRQVAAA